MNLLDWTPGCIPLRLDVPVRNRIAMTADRCMVLPCGLIIMASSSFAAEARPGDLKACQALYQQHCLRCHGARLDGKGPDAATLRVSLTDFYKYLSRV